MSLITRLLLDSVLYRDAKLSRENAGETKHKRNWVKGGHIDEIRNALFILVIMGFTACNIFKYMAGF